MLSPTLFPLHGPVCSVHTCVCVCLQSRIHVHGSQSLTADLFLGCFPFDLLVSPVSAPSTVIIDRMLCLPGFYMDAGDQTPVLTLAWQTLYQLSHLPSATNLFTSTDLHQLKELTFSVQSPGLILEQITDFYLKCSSIPVKHNKVQNTSSDNQQHRLLASDTNIKAGSYRSFCALMSMAGIDYSHVSQVFAESAQIPAFTCVSLPLVRIAVADSGCHSGTSVQECRVVWLYSLPCNCLPLDLR